MRPLEEPVFGSSPLGIRVRVGYVKTVSQRYQGLCSGWVTCACDCMCVCGEFRDEILLRGKECETPENP